jgi:hypothetical protein
LWGFVIIAEFVFLLVPILKSSGFISSKPITL